MFHEHTTSVFDQIVQVFVEVEPIEDEEDDVDTLAVTEQIRFEVQQEIIERKDYQIEAIPVSPEQNAVRGIDVILLITTIGAVLAAHQDLIISIFKTIEMVVGALSKRGRVQEIQIIADGKTLILKDVSKKTAQELMGTFEAQYP